MQNNMPAMKQEIQSSPKSETGAKGGKKVIKTSTGLIIIFAAAVMIFGGCYTYATVVMPQPDYSTSTTNTVTPKTTDTATNDWKTYTNDIYGFSLKYPKEWFIDSSNSDGLIVISNYKDGSKYDKSNTPSDYVSLLIRNIDNKTTPTIIEDDFVINQESKENVTIYSVRGSESLKSSRIIWAKIAKFKSGSTNFELEANGELSPDSATRKQQLNIFDKIVGTITVSSDATADWQTYTNSTYGFSFKYPTDWTINIVNNQLLSLGLNSTENEKNGSCRVSGCDLPNSMSVNLIKNVAELDSQSTSLKNYLDKKASLSDPVYTDVKEVSFGNKTGYQAKLGPNQFGGGKAYFYSFPDGEILKAWFFEEDKDTNADETSKIISTFQFTK